MLQQITNKIQQAASSAIAENYNDARTMGEIEKYAFQLITINNGLFSIQKLDNLEQALKHEKDKGYTPGDFEVKYLYNLNFKVINVLTDHAIHEVKITLCDQEEFTKNLAIEARGLIEQRVREVKQAEREKYLDNPHKALNCNNPTKLLDQEVKAYISRIKEEDKKRHEQLQEKNRAERQERQQREEQARRAWIDSAGSDRLKMMVEEGYEYRLTYELERTAIDYPEFILDESGELFEWEERANPSHEALKQAKTLDAEIVWVTDPQKYAGEALKLKPEWSRYVIIKPL